MYMYTHVLCTCIVQLVTSIADFTQSVPAALAQTA